MNILMAFNLPFKINDTDCMHKSDAHSSMRTKQVQLIEYAPT